MESEETEAMRIAKMQVAAALTGVWAQWCERGRVPDTQEGMVAAYRRMLKLLDQPEA